MRVSSFGYQAPDLQVHPVLDCTRETKIINLRLILRILKPHFYGTFILNQKTRTQLFPNYFEPILALGASKEGNEFTSPY